MHEKITGLFLGVGDPETHTVTDHHAGVADLAAGFAVEWRLVENDRTAVSCFEGLGFLAVLDHCSDDAFGRFRLIAKKLGRAELLAERKPDRFGCRFAGAGPR